jgi:hypothetical protein
VTTLRLTQAQKRKVEKARKLLAARQGRRVTQGDVVERLADKALEDPAWWVEQGPQEESPWKDDPLTSPDIGWDFGPTDYRTVDRLLYGRRR